MPEMQFQSFAEFLAMGGDAVYVWTSYGFFALVIAFNVIQPALAKRKIIRNLKACWQREAARRAQSSQMAQGTEE